MTSTAGILRSLALALAAAALSAAPAAARTQATLPGRETTPVPLATSPSPLVAAGARVGTQSAPVNLTVLNNGSKGVKLTGFDLFGAESGDFLISSPTGLPLTVPAGASKTLSVVFAPTFPGPRSASLGLVQVPHPAQPILARLSATAFGPLGAEVLVNAGGLQFPFSEGFVFLADYGFTTPGQVSTHLTAAIQGTVDDELYQTARTGSTLNWAFALPNGDYRVDMHFAELEKTGVGQRVFDVRAEGVRKIQSLDVFDRVGGFAAYETSFYSKLADGTLNLNLVASAGNAMVSGIEVRSTGTLTALPASADFAVLNLGQSGSKALTITNTGLNTYHVDELLLEVASGSGQDFSVDFDNQSFAGGVSSVSFPVQVTLAPGQSIPATLHYVPTAHGYHALKFKLRGDGPVLNVDVVGGAGVGGDPYLHPVLLVPPVVVDYDLSGTEPVLLDGSGSHTHQPGKNLAGWEWRESTVLLGSAENLVHDFGYGPHTVELSITDNNVPPHALSDSANLKVVGVDDVPGVLTLYYLPGAGQSSDNLIDGPAPANADFAEARSALVVTEDAGIGGSPFTGDVMVRALAQLDVTTAATYQFVAQGGHDLRLRVDGALVSGPIALTAGLHDVEVRWAVTTTAELPLEVLAGVDGGNPAAIDPTLLAHDQRDTPPVINDMPSEGINLGGNAIAIDGFGFFPQDQVVVHWGGQDFTSAEFTSWSAERIEFVSPPGSGQIGVTVQSPHGTSAARVFEYKADGPVPVVFDYGPTVGLDQPVAAAWGPDGRLYVVSLSGTLHALTYNDDYSLQSAVVYPGVSQQVAHDAMGIAFDPYAPLGTVRAYVAHTQTYAQGGGGFSGPSPYPGVISRLDGPNFDTPVPIVTGLPTSNHDHAVNGMVFDDNGDLLVCVGGNTNAGIKDPGMGDLPESPLSAAILKVSLSKPNFNGAITYVDSATGLPNNDQVFGGSVDVAPGVHVSVHASGLRNPFDLVYTTWGDVYATDNGPNSGFGVASTGANTQTTFQVSDLDELLRVEYGRYYGHPNRARGRYEPIENVWYPSSALAVPGFTQCIKPHQSSIDGIVEYTASAFAGQIRGQLFVQRYGAGLTRVELSADKKSVAATYSVNAFTSALNLVTGPGGALIAVDYTGWRVASFLPQDAAATGLVAYDVFPNRAPFTGGQSFVIGGAGFGTLSDTTVQFGSMPATLTSVTPTRIRGVVPNLGAASSTRLAITVTVGATSQTLTNAFLALPAQKGGIPGTWSAHASMPVPLGEVASGVINGKLYVVGETSVKTLAYDFATKTWVDNLAVRPFVGHHHAAEVHNGKLYLIGGLGAGEGKVQIYNPVTNAWTLGANMPWSAGSVSTCRIGGLIYASGGIAGGTTVDNCASYDIAANTWTVRAPMPVGKGRNHAAAATDGTRFWIFGGRGVGSGADNVVANGFADVQVYNPATDSWSASFQGGSTLVPMPIGRGGTGKAVFYKGEFYVLGGETLNGSGATSNNVYDRVDVYDPATNAWRQEAAMITPRHGICPIAYQGRIWVAGGGVVAGFSNSAAFESFYKP